MDEDLLNKFSEILKEKDIDINQVLENINTNSNRNLPRNQNK